MASMPEIVDMAVKAIPAPKDGKDGAKGETGPVGPQGPEGTRGEPGERGPAGEPGMAGTKGEMGPVGPAGAAGKDGIDGRDGLDVKDLLVAEDGSLIATFSDGRTKNLGPFRGKDGMNGRDGEPGRDGKDGAAGQDGAPGFGFDDLELCETEAGIVIRFAKGDRVKDFRLPIVRDCGVYKLGTVYNKGDGISHAGSFWIAQKDGVTERPEQCDGWRLAVKRGKDRADPVKIGG
jgi:integrin beta 3